MAAAAPATLYAPVGKLAAAPVKVLTGAADVEEALLVDQVEVGLVLMGATDDEAVVMGATVVGDAVVAAELHSSQAVVEVSMGATEAEVVVVHSLHSSEVVVVVVTEIGATDLEVVVVVVHSSH